jgi:hypothetical protein
VPIAATGRIIALFLRDMPFSISAAIGFIATFGIAILNGVVLTSYIRDIEATGVGAREAAARGAKMRLRPVMMTALVATLGFLPMALSTSAGAEVPRPHPDRAASDLSLRDRFSAPVHMATQPPPPRKSEDRRERVISQRFKASLIRAPQRCAG